MLGIFAFLLAIILGRFAQLQILQHDYWSDRAEAMQERIIELPPQRGAILDCNGDVLAVDVKAMAIAVDGINITNPAAAVSILTDELALSRTELESKIF